MLLCYWPWVYTIIMPYPWFYYYYYYYFFWQLWQRFCCGCCFVFQAILSDLFPGKEIPDHDYGKLQATIEECLLKKGCQVSRSFTLDSVNIRHLRWNKAYSWSTTVRTVWISIKLIHGDKRGVDASLKGRWIHGQQLIFHSILWNFPLAVWISINFVIQLLQVSFLLLTMYYRLFHPW